MKLYHVVAMARNRVIGKDNKLPWHFPADLKFFKQLTTGGTVIMGRKTFESIYEATKEKMLPGRLIMILTRRKKIEIPVRFEGLRAEFYHSLTEVLNPQNIVNENAFIIGGAEIFGQTFDKIDGIYLTQIDQDYEGDTFYPEVPPLFKEKRREVLQENNPKIEMIYFEKENHSGSQ